MKQHILQYFDIPSFQNNLLDWYEDEKRDLPWRQSKNPYYIWVSEIMLQQTRVDTVIPYFKNFITLFPTIQELAAADEQEVLKAWEGLGYYSRARNLHHAAKEVVHSFNGKIPNDPEQFSKLKGVGPYTKGAVMSIAFGLPEPAVDANVMRVLSRVLRIEENISEHRVKRDFEDITRTLVPVDDASSFNQGLMELGALICTPREPICMFCPIQSQCRAYEDGVQNELPIKGKKKKQRHIAYAALLLECNGEYVIQQRPDSGLLANLWQFPMIPLDEMTLEDGLTWLSSEYGVHVDLDKEVGTLKHVFSHIIWNLTIYKGTITDQERDPRLEFVHPDAFDLYPFPVSHLKMIPYIE